MSQKARIAESPEIEVVISGIGGVFPKSNNLAEFSEQLLAGENLLTKDHRKVEGGFYQEIPDSRGSLKNEIIKFDNTFFGVSKAVAFAMDELTCHLLQRTYEAIIDAGLSLHELKGSNTTVFMGTCHSDSDLVWTSSANDGYGIMGRNRCMNSNRVSYWLDIKGTSMSTDGGWVNGFSNLFLGWDAIRRGICDTALVGVANLQSHILTTLQFNDLGFLSEDGITRSFDDSANGCGRASSIVTLVLQRADVAKRSYATIGHILSTFIAEKHTVMQKTTQKEWERLLNLFYEESKIDKNKICYLEAHGTGHKDEDANELNAIAEVFCKNRKTPLLVGCVKSNMGHAETASATCGLVKSVIAMEKGKIPKNLHYNSPNSLCPGLTNGKLKVVDTNMPFPEDGWIAINSHSFSGNYAHLVLKPHKKKKELKNDSIPRLVLLSDRTNEHVETLIEQVEAEPYDPEFIGLMHEIYWKPPEKNLGRGYTILPKPENSVHENKIFDGQKRPIWFIFAGMGSQWPKMGKRLMDLPVFKNSIQRSHKILKEKGLDLIAIITDDDPKIFDNILHSFVGIAAIQIALIDVLNTLKIVPDGLIGHSVGELGCSYADGCFTAEQMILAAYYRGRASKETELIKGSMAAIGKGYKDIKDQLPEDIEVACHNSSDSCTLSGPTESIHKYVEKIKEKGIFAKSVNVSNIAYHSRYIKPAAPKLLEYLKQIVPNPKLRSSKWISTSNAQDKWETELAKYCSAEYHTNNLLSSVLFEEGSKHIPKNAICIEIAPHGLLQAILKRSLGEEVVNIPLTNRTCEDPLIFLLQALGKIYMAGVHFQIMELYPKIEFPVSRGTQHLSPLVHWHEQIATCLPTPLGRKVFYSLKDRLIKLTNDDIGCILDGKNVYPVSLFTNLLWEIFASIKKMKPEECPVVFQNININRFIEVSLTGDVSAFYFLKGSGSFEIFENQSILTNGNISVIKEVPLEECTYKLKKPDLFNEEIYRELERKGYTFGEYFKVLKAVAFEKTKILAEIPLRCDFEQIIEAMIQLQLLRIKDHEDFLYFPQYFKTLEIFCKKHDELKTSENQNSNLVIVFDLVLNKIKCGGILMKGLRFLETPKISKNFKFESFNFFPFMNPQFQDVKTFIDFCFEVVLNNSSSVKNFFSVNILEVLEKSHPASVGNYLKEAYSDYLIKVNSVTNPEIEWKAQNIEFAISEDIYLKKVTEFLINGGFILVRATSNTKIPLELKFIGKFINKAKQEFYFLKKVQLSNEKFEFVMMDKNTSSLMVKLRELKYSEKITFVVAHHEPSQGILSFIKMMEAETAIPLRWLFILDPQAPPFSSQNPFYTEQIYKGLKTNVYNKGDWGWFSKYDYLKDAIKDEINFNLDENQEIKPHYISFELSDNPIQLELIEYSGKMKNIRVMGISELEDYRKIIPDNHLIWELPESWTMEDAVTVPNAYAQAYFSLVILRNNLASNLLVTDAMSVIGQAHLNVAFTLGFKVYVTVNNEKEVFLIKKLFPQLEDLNIMIHNEPDFDVKYKLEKKFKGMDIIINLLDGQIFFSVLNFIDKFAKMFYYGRENVKKNVQMGSGVFLESLSLYAMTPKTIIKLHEEDKKKIHELVETGIKSGVVKPLPKVILSLEELQKIQNTPDKDYGRIKTILQVNNLHTNSRYVKFNSQNSYIIIGDETDLWADIMEWLVKRGLKNIVAGYKTHSKTIELRIPQLKQRDKTFIYNHQDFNQLLKEAENLGPVAAVFYVTLTSGDESCISSSIDKLYRNSDGHLLVISRTQGYIAEMCANRNKLKFPSTNFIYNLEQIPIKQNLEYMSKLCGKNAIIHISQHFMNTSSDFSLINFVPSSVEDFCDLGSSLENDIKIVPMNTLVGPGKQEFLEVTPLLIIPGFQKNPVEFVQKMVTSYLYPAACIKIPNLNLTIKQMASFILPEVIKYNKGNLYNIIGISWGCHIAMELTGLLEEMGAKVGLILIQGPILNANIFLKQSLELNLLNLIQGYGKTTTNLMIEKEQSNWDVNLNKALGTFNLPSKQINNFRNAIEFIYNNLQALLRHDISKFQCKGPLTIISSDKQPVDYKALSKTCKFISIRRLPVSNEELLLSTMTWKIIHGSTICQNMLSKSIHDCSWPALEEFIETQTIALIKSQNTAQPLSLKSLIRS